MRQVSYCRLLLVAVAVLVRVVVGWTSLESSNLFVPFTAKIGEMGLLKNIFVSDPPKQVDKISAMSYFLNGVSPEDVELGWCQWRKRLYREQWKRDIRWQYTFALRGEWPLHYNVGGVTMLDILSNVPFRMCIEHRVIRREIKSESFSQIYNSSLGRNWLCSIFRDMEFHTLDGDPGALISSKVSGCLVNLVFGGLGSLDRGVGGALALIRSISSKGSIGSQNVKSTLANAKGFYFQPVAVFVQGILLCLVGILVFSRGYDRDIGWMYFLGFAVMVLGGILVTNGFYVLMDKSESQRNAAHFCQDFSGDNDKISSNVAHV
jgi:hypothetical protein